MSCLVLFSKTSLCNDQNHTFFGSLSELTIPNIFRMDIQIFKHMGSLILKAHSKYAAGKRIKGFFLHSPKAYQLLPFLAYPCSLWPTLALSLTHSLTVTLAQSGSLWLTLALSGTYWLTRSLLGSLAVYPTLPFGWISSSQMLHISMTMQRCKCTFKRRGFIFFVRI